MKQDKILGIMLLSIGVLIVFSIFFSLASLNHVRHMQLPHPGRDTNINITSIMKSSSAITMWMTFDYINTIFSLPEDYLKTQLHIQDARYPNISLKSVVKQNKLDRDVFLKSVQQSVDEYVRQNSQNKQ